MRKLLVAVLCASLLLMLAPAALAQSSSAEAGSRAEGAPPPPNVVFQEGGIVMIGGDVGTDCNSFAISVDQGYFSQLTQKQVQSVLEQCRLAGFLPSDNQYEAPVALPGTGGPILLSPVLVGGVLLLTGFGARRLVARR